MAVLNQGDTVQINAREQTAADGKSGLYFPHYAGLRGRILKVYGEEASVLVDRATLPEALRARHEDSERALRQRWLDGLSEEGRGRLTSKEKEFALNYAVLVAVKDVTAVAPDIAATATSEAALRDETGISVQAAGSPRRASEKDLDSAEAAELSKRNTGGGKGGPRKS